MGRQCGTPSRAIDRRHFSPPAIWFGMGRFATPIFAMPSVYRDSQSTGLDCGEGRRRSSATLVGNAVSVPVARGLPSPPGIQRNGGLPVVERPKRALARAATVARHRTLAVDVGRSREESEKAFQSS